MWGTVAVKARCLTSARGSLPVTFDRAGRRATTQSHTRRSTHRLPQSPPSGFVALLPTRSAPQSRSPRRTPPGACPPLRLRHWRNGETVTSHRHVSSPHAGGPRFRYRRPCDGLQGCVLAHTASASRANTYGHPRTPIRIGFAPPYAYVYCGASADAWVSAAVTCASHPIRRR